MRRTRVAAVQWLTVASVVGLLAALAWLVGSPGRTTGRLVLFALLAGAGLVGAIAVLTRRGRLAVVAAAVLALLGFWQAVLWVFVYPVVVLLAVAAVVIGTPSDTGPGGPSEPVR